MGKTKDLGHLAHIVAYDASNNITVPANLTVTGTITGYATTASLSSYVPTSRTITINGTTFDLSANRNWDITSMIYPAAGIALSTGTAWGTSITNNSGNWNTAFGWGNHASAGYLTGITSTQVTTALGFTPYNATNPAGYIASITSLMVTNALGFTPYNSTNPSGYITGITSANVTTALGFTPYNATNPAGYITGISFANVSAKPTTLSGYGITDAVPSGRTLTINGTAFDLSANRSWTITSSETDTLATVTARGATTTAAITTGVLTVNTGGTGTWGPFVVTSTSQWGDGATQYVTIGAGGAAGIMINNPHIVWNTSEVAAAVKFGRSGGISSGSYYVIGTGASNNFFINKDGAISSPVLNINSSGNATFSGTISASNYSGTHSGSSSGTNTGDQTNISGNAATASSVSGLTLTNSSNGINPDSVTQNQIGYNISVNLFGQTDGGLYSSAYSSAWIHQIYGDFRTGQMAIRGKNSGTWQAWRTVVDSGNIGNYKANGAILFWAQSHPNDYYLVNNWTGTHWYITSNHPAAVRVGYADSAGSAGSAGNVSSISSAVGGAYTWTGIQYFQTNNGGQAVNNSNSAILQAYSTGNNSAFMSFHRGGYYAVNFGLDSDNVMRLGGWSAGANRWTVDMSNGNMTNAGSITAGGNLSCNTLNTGNVINIGYTRNNESVATTSFRGLEFHADGNRDYYIGKDAGAWTQPLSIHFFTGVRIRAHHSYGGTQFYNIATSVTVASFNEGDNNFRGYYDVIAYASDRRLKENIQVIENALDKIKKLTGMTYNWNNIGNQYGWSPSKEREVGVFAQDVQYVLPEAVKLAPFDNDGGKSKSGENFLTVKYEKIVPLLIEAIKEQQGQIEEQAEQIIELKSIINGITS